MRIDSSGNVGIGTTTPSVKLNVTSSDAVTTIIDSTASFSPLVIGGSSSVGGIQFKNTSFTDGFIYYDNSADMIFYTSGTERVRINSNGNISSVTSLSSGQFNMNDNSAGAGVHDYIKFLFQGSTIGDIDTLNNTVIRYNTFTGGHWSQFHDGTNPKLKKGTVMSLTGDKLEYSKCEKKVTNDNGVEELQKFEIAGTHEIGSEVTVPNDQYGEENSTTTATVISNSIAEHLVKVKVSDSVSDKAVYGVWSGKYNDGDLSVEALGTSTIRIKQGEVLEVGDLLESAGDGTAQKQSDGIIKNSTIAKVTSPTPIETFDDNSFLVSCVLYCG
jgi:hypothetical protein